MLKEEKDNLSHLYDNKYANPTRSTLRLGGFIYILFNYVDLLSASYFTPLTNFDPMLRFLNKKVETSAIDRQ
jgi:hypothetical protein